MRHSRLFGLKIIHRYSSSSSSSSRRSTKNRNHYDNLEIETDATHGEIKSAYFKLSKQYHPDMNSSEEAKHKFKDISSAYEVLGNHGKRKQYDRGLRISPTDYEEQDIPMKKTDIGDITEEARRAHSAIFRNRTQPDGKPIYDFDAWTEAHYGRMFRRRQKEMSQAQVFMRMRREQKESETSMKTELSIVSVMILVAAIVLGASLHFHDLDRPQVFIPTDQTVTQNSNNVERRQS